MKGTIIIVLLFGLVVVAAFVASNNTQPTRQIAPIPTDDYGGLDEAIIAELNTIETQMTEARNLPALRPVRRQFITSQGAIREFFEGIYAEVNESDLQQLNQFYQSFDFIDSDVDLRQTLVDLFGFEIVGIYSFRSERLTVLVDESVLQSNTLSLDEIRIYAHEYAHALQDQHFSPIQLYIDARGNSDRTLATQSLVEGDATFATQQYRLMFVDDAPSSDSPDANNATISGDFPGILGAELSLPYQAGTQFVAYLYEHGGWELVNQSYENPPLSTEHIYHPDRYLAGDEPQLIVIRPTTDAWEDPVWRDSIGGGVLGEFYLREYLHLYLDDEAVDIAATGWDGDNYVTLYNAETDQMAWLLRLALDTPDDMTEFVDAYIELTNIRLESEREDFSPTEFCWETDEEAVCIFTDSATLQYGNDNHMLITSAPELAQARALILTQQRDDLGDE